MPTPSFWWFRSIQFNEVATGEVSADTAVAGEIFNAVADLVQWPVGYAERIEEASGIRNALIRVKETQAGNPAMLEIMTREEPVLAMAKQWGM